MLKLLPCTVAALMLWACALDQSLPVAQSAFDEAAGPWQTVEINGVLYRRAAAKPTAATQGDLLITVPIRWEYNGEGGIRFADTVQIAGRTYTADCNQDTEEAEAEEMADDVGNTFDTASDWALDMPGAGAEDNTSNVSQDFQLEYPGDVDIFRIRVSKVVIVGIGTVSDMDTRGWLHDDEGLMLAYNDDGENNDPGVYDFALFTILDPGTYYVRVEGFSGATGSYKLLAVVANEEVGRSKPVATNSDIVPPRTAEAFFSLAQTLRSK